MVTRRPRARSRCPRLEAVRPLPREEATPPVTKMCFGLRHGLRLVTAVAPRTRAGRRTTGECRVRGVAAGIRQRPRPRVARHALAQRAPGPAASPVADRPAARRRAASAPRRPAAPGRRRPRRPAAVPPTSVATIAAARPRAPPGRQSGWPSQTAGSDDRDVGGGQQVGDVVPPAEQPAPAGRARPRSVAAEPAFAGPSPATTTSTVRQAGSGAASATASSSSGRPFCSASRATRHDQPGVRRRAPSSGPGLRPASGRGRAGGGGAATSGRSDPAAHRAGAAARSRSAETHQDQVGPPGHDPLQPGVRRGDQPGRDQRVVQGDDQRAACPAPAAGRARPARRPAARARARHRRHGPAGAIAGSSAGRRSATAARRSVPATNRAPDAGRSRERPAVLAGPATTTECPGCRKGCRPGSQHVTADAAAAGAEHQQRSAARSRPRTGHLAAEQRPGVAAVGHRPSTTASERRTVTTSARPAHRRPGCGPTPGGSASRSVTSRPATERERRRPAAATSMGPRRARPGRPRRPRSEPRPDQQRRRPRVMPARAGQARARAACAAGRPCRRRPG